MQEQIEARRRIIAEYDRVGRKRGDRDLVAHGGGDLLVDQAVVEQVLDDRGDAGDCEGVAHGALPLRRRRYSSRDIGFFALADVSRRGATGGATAVSSTRPIW